MAGISTQGDEVGRVQFKLGVFVIRNDVVDFERLLPAAGRTARLLLQMLTPHP